MAPSALSNHLDSSSTDTAAAPATNNASSARMAATKLGVRCWEGWNLSWAEKVLRAKKNTGRLGNTKTPQLLTNQFYRSELHEKGASVPASPPQVPQRPVLRIGTPEKPIRHRNTSVVVAAGHLPTCASVLSKRSSRGRWARISWDGQRLRISINHRQFGPPSTESVSVVFCGQKKWSMIWSMYHIVLCTALLNILNAFRRLASEIATVILSNRTQSSKRLLKAPMIWFCDVTLNTSHSVNRHSKLYSLEPNIFFCPLWEASPGSHTLVVSSPRSGRPFYVKANLLVGIRDLGVKAWIADFCLCFKFSGIPNQASFSFFHWSALSVAPQ